MQISRTDAVMSGNCKTPKGLYRIRCIQVSFTEKNKSSGNPMTDLTCEIVKPEEVIEGDVTYKVAGQRLHVRLIHKPDSAEANFQFMDKLKIDHQNNYDSRLADAYFRGTEFDIALSSTEQIKRYDPVAGEKVGKPILDGEGQEITNGWQIQAWPSDVPLNCNPNKVDLGPY